MGQISGTWELLLCEYWRKSMIIGEKNTDLKRLKRLKLRFLTEIGRFHWNQGEEVAHFAWFGEPCHLCNSSKNKVSSSNSFCQVFNDKHHCSLHDFVRGRIRVMVYRVHLSMSGIWTIFILAKRRSFSQSVFFQRLTYSCKRSSHVLEIEPLQGLMSNILFQTHSLHPF